MDRKTRAVRLEGSYHVPARNARRKILDRRPNEIKRRIARAARRKGRNPLILTKNWRAAILGLLLIGPIAAYVGLGMLWLQERGWWPLVIASSLWVATGVVFAALGARWTKSKDAFLPPIDWEEPETFAPRDRAAWEIVREEADRGEHIAAADLTNFDVYVETGKHLARRLAAHYVPNATDPIENVPLAELLTALELAAEDLGKLSRQIPGGDIINLAHLRQAVQVAGYLQKANDVYSYLLPIFQPWTGIPRLAAQRFVSAPAWRDMQSNLLRWFFAAYVNRLGSHLVEMYGGRLSIGADAYRRLRKSGHDEGVEVADESEGPTEPPTIAVAAAKGLERSSWIETLKNVTISGGLGRPTQRLGAASWLEPPPYEPLDVDKKAARAERAKSVAAIANADMLILMIDGAREDLSGDRRFLELWRESYQLLATLERPPLLALALEANDASVISPSRMERIRVDLGLAANETPLLLSRSDARADSVAAALISAWPAVEHAHFVRHFHQLSQRSRAGRLYRQIRRQGRNLWKGWKGNAT